MKKLSSVVLRIKRSYRGSQFVLCKTPFEGNVGHLSKNCNAAERKLCASLRASRQGAIRCVAFPRHMPNMPSEIRLAADPLATRYMYALFVTPH